MIKKRGAGGRIAPMFFKAYGESPQKGGQWASVSKSKTVQSVNDNILLQF